MHPQSLGGLGPQAAEALRLLGSVQIDESEARSRAIPALGLRPPKPFGKRSRVGLTSPACQVLRGRLPATAPAGLGLSRCRGENAALSPLAALLLCGRPARSGNLGMRGAYLENTCSQIASPTTSWYRPPTTYSYPRLPELPQGRRPILQPGPLPQTPNPCFQWGALDGSSADSRIRIGAFCSAAILRARIPVLNKCVSVLRLPLYVPWTELSQPEEVRFAVAETRRRMTRLEDFNAMVEEEGGCWRLDGA